MQFVEQLWIHGYLKGGILVNMVLSYVEGKFSFGQMSIISQGQPTDVHVRIF